MIDCSDSVLLESWFPIATGSQPPVFEMSDGLPLLLRSISVRASAPLVAETLMGYRFAPNGETEANPQAVDVSIEPLVMSARSFNLSSLRRSSGVFP